MYPIEALFLMHYKYLNVLDEECEYLKNYLTHETKFLDYIKSNAEAGFQINALSSASD